jgi:hypothetical protein
LSWGDAATGVDFKSGNFIPADRLDRVADPNQGYLASTPKERIV